jgi:hypothetical protein
LVKIITLIIIVYRIIILRAFIKTNLLSRKVFNSHPVYTTLGDTTIIIIQILESVLVWHCYVDLLNVHRVLAVITVKLTFREFIV